MVDGTTANAWWTRLQRSSLKNGGVRLVAFQQSGCLGLCALDMRFTYGSSSCSLQGKSYDKIDKTRCSFILLQPNKLLQCVECIEVTHLAATKLTSTLSYRSYRTTFPADCNLTIHKWNVSKAHNPKRTLCSKATSFTPPFYRRSWQPCSPCVYISTINCAYRWK